MGNLQVGDIVIINGQSMRIVGHTDNQGNSEFLFVDIHDWNVYKVLHSLGNAHDVKDEFDAGMIEIIRRSQAQTIRVL
jgi:hypothetical protein